MSEGSVIIIGGAEDKVRDRVILSRFATLAGGRDAIVAVISTASSLGLEAGERYTKVLKRAGRGQGPHDPRGHPSPGQRRHRSHGPARRDRHLHDRRQPAPPVIDDRRDAAGRRRPGAVPPGCRGRGHERGRVGDVQPHDRVRGQRGDAQAPDGPDRRGARRPARRDRRPAFPAAEPARAPAQPDRPEPEPARSRAWTRTRPASSARTT